MYWMVFFGFPKNQQQTMQEETVDMNNTLLTITAAWHVPFSKP